MSPLGMEPLALAEVFTAIGAWLAVVVLAVTQALDPPVRLS